MKRCLSTVLFLGVCAAAAGCGDDNPVDPVADAGADAAPDAPPPPDGGEPDGGEPDGGPPDAPAPVTACHELDAPAATLSTYPANLTGSLIGGGADLSVPDDLCTDDTFWALTTGEDRVFHLTNLVVGSAYAITLNSDFDSAFYVINSCDPDAAGPAPGQCPILADATGAGELGGFRATASEAYLVIDTFLPSNQIGSGDFAISVDSVECLTDADCSGAAPHCGSWTCVACVDDFDCTDPAAPVCDEQTCVAGTDSCTGDDTSEPNDGPAAATVITGALPQSIPAAICSSPGIEADFYRVELTAEHDLVQVIPSDLAATLTLQAYDEAGNVWGYDTGPGRLGVEPGAGTFYVKVQRVDPNGAAATPYTLNLIAAQCQTSFDCSGGTPVCDAFSCGAATDLCTGDDAGEPDDGPSQAQVLSGPLPQTVQAAVCTVPDTERDWYQFTVAPGEGRKLNLTTSDQNAFFGIVLYNGNGFVVDSTYGSIALELVAEGLDGTYSVEIQRLDLGLSAAAEYDLVIDAI